MLSLVTGGSGFVGSHLAERLSQGGARVRFLMRGSSDVRLLQRLPGAELFPLDLLQAAPDHLAQALEGVSVVYHLAALVRARNAQEYRRANVEATIALYRAFGQAAGGGGRFVFCSSLAAAGPARDGAPVTECSEPRPISAYGRSKLEAEQLLAASAGPPVTCLRPPAVYGPRDRAILPLFKLAAAGWRVCLGSPQRRFSLIHAGDLAAALEQSAAAPAGVGTFCVEDGAPHAWGEIVDLMARGCGRRGVRVVIPDAAVHAAAAAAEAVARLTGRPALLTREKARDLTTPDWICSSAAARERFGFAPRWDIADGLRETCAWYRASGWL
jgi:nucleoside-diphosphate-sugar epimerase